MVNIINNKIILIARRLFGETILLITTTKLRISVFTLNQYAILKTFVSILKTINHVTFSIQVSVHSNFTVTAYYVFLHYHQTNAIK